MCSMECSAGIFFSVLLVSVIWGSIGVQICHVWDINGSGSGGLEEAEGGESVLDTCWDGEGQVELGYRNGSCGLATDRWVIWTGSQAGMNGESLDQLRGCSRPLVSCWS